MTRAMVSLPERSVTWTKVSLNEAKMWATPNTSSPSLIWGPRDVVTAGAWTVFALGAYTGQREPEPARGAPF